MSRPDFRRVSFGIEPSTTIESLKMPHPPTVAAKTPRSHERGYKEAIGGNRPTC